MTVRRLLLNKALQKLALDRWDADRVVGYYEDGEEVTEAMSALRNLTQAEDVGLSVDAQAFLEELAAARERRLDS